jgi:hypothetical protein
MTWRRIVPSLVDPAGRPVAAPLDDAQTIALMAAEMARLREPMILMVRPEGALMTAGLVQLALRHPDLSEDMRDQARALVDTVREYFAECPTVLDILHRGDNPAEDVRG